ncbi:UvrD-helicase domain-containing protein [Sphingomonas aurantiaca]
MTRPPDHASRRRALTELNSSLLVEAGAGTGKTSLLAGRVAMLLAAGVDPDAICAITFTELAAAELGQRIRQTVGDLLGGNVPAAMRDALPEGLAADGLENLRAASGRMDDLRTATIHGFCQDLIRGYAVEADLDPGAQVADRDTAAAAFDSVFEAWLRRRLDRTVSGVDAISVLSRDDPRRMERTLRDLAQFRLSHRTARPPSADLGGRPDHELSDAVDSYRRWADGVPPESWTLGRVAELEGLARFYAGSFEPAPDFARLWELAHPPRISGMRKGSLDIQRPRRLSAWRKVAGDAEGACLDAASLQHHDRVVEAFGELLGKIGGALVAALSGELDEVLAEYSSHKRSAALLDFDDLLEAACRLIRLHEAVRSELSRRHRHILVDEFQDTDPLQCELIFRLTTDEPVDDWRRIRPRAGALFAVGDPKQAIYQFRGAHVANYEAAKSAFVATWPDNLLRITANFRSRQSVLGHVNRAFAAPLAAAGQPGHTELDWIRADNPARASAVKLTVKCSPAAFRGEKQDGEAEAVAAACRRIIGSPMEMDDGTIRAVAPSDIALLAPTGNDLWRYERELRKAGIPFASHAGKAIFRRQEAQDFVTLARVLADGRDTLAFGALMRGPLVGLTDEEILDIAETLPHQAFEPARFTVRTDPNLVGHVGARQVLRTLQRLRSLLRSTSPAQLMTLALEAMNVRAIVARRDPRNAAAAEANLDRLIERSRGYAIRGMAAFTHNIGEEWFSGKAEVEGRPDAEGASVEIMSVHSAKGLEWPIVIPINACVGLRPRSEHVHLAADDTIHWMLGDVAPPRLAAAVSAEAESLARERVRLWYVACTRARDMLVLPFVPGADRSTWAGAVDLLIEDMPEMVAEFGDVTTPAPIPNAENPQDAETFAAEALLLKETSAPIGWVRPSDRDGDRQPGIEMVAEDYYETGESSAPVAGSRVRGLLLHKLLEEVIEEGLTEDAPILSERAAELVDQIELLSGETIGSTDFGEVAALAMKALAMPEIAALRSRLRAEVPINGMTSGGRPMAGRADAVAIDDEGRISVIIDWKSDVAPSPLDREAHVEQVLLYVEATGAERALVVYPSIGLVRSVERP